MEYQKLSNITNEDVILVAKTKKVIKKLVLKIRENERE